MSGKAESAAPPGDLGPLEALGRVAKIFYAPRIACAEIRERPNWVFPLLLSILFSFLVCAVLFSRPEWQQALQKALASVPQTQGELAKVYNLKAMQVGAWIFALAAPVIVNLFRAMLLWGLAVLLEGKTTFLAVFSFEVHAQMVTVLPQAAGLIVLVASRGADLSESGGSLPFSLAYFLPSVGTAPALRALASTVDLFTFWYWALVLLGLPIVASLPRRRLLLPLLVLWIVGLLVRAATLTLAFSQS